jgi:transcriptional regulator with XRE-family HTH domain
MASGLLGRLMARDQLKQDDVAKRLGISQPHLSRILAGKQRPNLELGVRIKEEFDIDPALWLAAPLDKPRRDGPEAA